jgi:hypothetical protein
MPQKHNPRERSARARPLTEIQMVELTTRLIRLPYYPAMLMSLSHHLSDITVINIETLLPPS